MDALVKFIDSQKLDAPAPDLLAIAAHVAKIIKPQCSFNKARGKFSRTCKFAPCITIHAFDDSPHTILALYNAVIKAEAAQVLLSKEPIGLDSMAV